MKAEFLAAAAFLTTALGVLSLVRCATGRVPLILEENPRAFWAIVAIILVGGLSLLLWSVLFAAWYILPLAGVLTGLMFSAINRADYRGYVCAADGLMFSAMAILALQFFTWFGY